jgi:hypothetical protein
MDALAIVAILTGISGCSVAILTHLKHSECCGVFKIDTRTPQPTQQSTPKHTPQPSPQIQPKHTNYV